MAAEKPDWWHKAGYKLHPEDRPIVTPHRTPSFGVRFISDAESERATLSIHTILGVSNDWYVRWRTRHHETYYPGAPHTEGGATLDDIEFAEAFGLTDQFQPFQGSDAELVERYNATVARTGRFIRAGNFLNVPGPGTGLEGDANLSIYLSDGVKDAANRLLSQFVVASGAWVSYQPERRTLAAAAGLVQIGVPLSAASV